MELPALPDDLGSEVEVTDLEAGTEYYVLSFTRRDLFFKARIERIDRNEAGAPQYVIFERGAPLGVFGVGMDSIGAQNIDEYKQRIKHLFRFFTIVDKNAASNTIKRAFMRKAIQKYAMRPPGTLNNTNTGGELYKLYAKRFANRASNSRKTRKSRKSNRKTRRSK